MLKKRRVYVCALILLFVIPFVLSEKVSVVSQVVPEQKTVLVEQIACESSLDEIPQYFAEDCVVKTCLCDEDLSDYMSSGVRCQGEVGILEVIDVRSGGEVNE
jgi:hypothetical protein